MLGIDGPETKRNNTYEKVEEWEGIEDDKYPADRGENAEEVEDGSRPTW